MILLKKILSNSIWLLIGNSIGRITMFLTNIIAARILSQELFGEFMMIRSTISMLEGIISGSLGSPMIKHVAETHQEDEGKLQITIDTLLVTNIIISVFFAIILFILAPLVVEKFFIGKNELIKALHIGSILLVATNLASLIQSILVGLEKYKKLAFSGILSSIIAFPIILALIYKFALYGAILGVASYFLIDFMVKFFQFRQIYKKNILQTKIKYIWVEGKKLLSFSLPIFLSVIVNGIAFWYIRILTVNTTQGFEKIAIFDAAFQWMTIIMIITGATTSVVLPMLSKNLLNRQHEVRNIFKITLIVNLLISILMSAIFIYFSKKIMSIYGQDYINGYIELIILSITSVFFTLATIYNRYMVAFNIPWNIFYVTLISILIMYLVYYLEFLHGSKNLAISIFAYYLTSTVIYITIKYIIKR